MAVIRTRNYVSVLYPESARPNWRDILSAECIKAFVSPLHDKDVNPDGEVKKPHYHVILAFNTLKTQVQAQAIFDKIGAVHCQPVNDLVGYCRYLVHMDNPEKYQYDPTNVESFCGADYSEVIKTAADRYKALSDICDYICRMGYMSYCALLDDLRLTNYEWFKVAADNSIFFTSYLKSKLWTDKAIREGLLPSDYQMNIRRQKIIENLSE